MSQLVQNRPTTTLERKFPLTTIRSIGLSGLRDDWLAINGASSEEGDPVISCVFKTEFLTHLQQQTNGSITVLIGPSVEYAKKKDKKANIKFTKDESVQRNDIYKSHEVRVGSGEVPTSISNPPARRKARPVAQKASRTGKTGGVRSNVKPRAIPKPKPRAQALPNGNMPAPPPAPPALAGQLNGTRAPAVKPPPLSQQQAHPIQLAPAILPAKAAPRIAPLPPHKAAPPPPPVVSPFII